MQQAAGSGSSTGRRIRIVAAVLAGALVVAYLGAGLMVARMFSIPYSEPGAGTPTDRGLEYEEVRLTSDDGTELAAWWVAAGDDAQWSAVLVHGSGGSKAAPYVLETAPVYSELGFNLLLLDLRGHGDSSGDRFSGGDWEADDVRAALRWFEGQAMPTHRIVLHGWSLGGAAVLGAAPGEGVAAVVADSTYADLPRLLDELLPESGVPSFLIPGVVLAGRVVYGFDLAAVKPAGSAAELAEENTPVMLVQGTDDTEVDVGHFDELVVAHPDARPWLVDGVGHVEAFTRPEYAEELSRFLERVRRNGS